MSIEITSKSVPMYSVRYDGKYGIQRRKRFVTRRAAISRVAWWMIFDKYRDYEWANGIMDRGAPVAVHPPVGCECRGEYGAPDWSGCPVHDHGTGYYAKVHRRLVRFMETALEQEA
jgi:hypothetical protein